MKITVKLFASFRQYLPIKNRIDGIILEIEPSISPHQVLTQLKVPVEQAHLLLQNGVFIEPERRDQAIFKENDVFAVWPAVAGG